MKWLISHEYIHLSIVVSQIAKTIDFRIYIDWGSLYCLLNSKLKTILHFTPIFTLWKMIRKLIWRQKYENLTSFNSRASTNPRQHKFWSDRRVTLRTSQRTAQTSCFHENSRAYAGFRAITSRRIELSLCSTNKTELTLPEILETLTPQRLSPKFSSLVAKNCLIALWY